MKNHIWNDLIDKNYIDKHHECNRFRLTHLKREGKMIKKIWIRGILLFIGLFSLLVIKDSTIAAQKENLPPIEFKKVSIIENDQYFRLMVYLRTPLRGDSFSTELIRDYVKLSIKKSFRIIGRPDGFLIVGKGPLNKNSLITIQLLRGLRSNKGAILYCNISKKLKSTSPLPKISFLVKGRYLGRKGNLKIPVKIRNAKEIFLSIMYVPDRNLPIWEKADRWWQRDFEAVIVKRKKISLPSFGQDLYVIDLSRWLKDSSPGLYKVIIEGTSIDNPKKKSRDSIFIVYTDIGIIAKVGKRKVNVWTVNLTDGSFIPNVTIKAYSHKNVEIGTAKTDEEGYCNFTFDPAFGGRPFVITAKKGRDYSYLPIASTRTDLSVFEVGGVSRESVPMLTSFILERNLYRPGETLHYAVIIRNPETYEGVSIPIQIKIIDPRGRKLTIQNAITDKNGLASFSFPLHKGALTGAYTLLLKAGGKNLKEAIFMVETFVPERLRIKIEAQKRSLKIGASSIPVSINAEYLFGAPVANEKYRLFWEFVEDRSRLFKDYSFGPVHLAGETLTEWKGNITGILDKNGHDSITINFPGRKISGPLRLKLRAEVKEAGSERVSRSELTLPFRTLSVYPGLRIGSYTPCNKVNVQGILVDNQGKIVKKDTKLEYQIFEIRYDYVMTATSNRGFRWERTATRIPETDKRPLMTQNGHFSIEVKISMCWRDYLVSVFNPLNGTYSELLVPGWRGKGNKPPSPEILSVKLDSKEASPGDEVEATVSLPFPGKVLWTLEGDELISYRWMEGKEKISRFRFIVPNNTPTLYITAYLYRTKPNYILTRAFGVARIRVVPRNIKAPLLVKVPDTIRNGKTLEINISAPPGGKAILSVVDEGILQITHFRSPDLYRDIIPTLRLGVNTSEGLGWIIPKVVPLPGGGLAAMRREFTPPKPPRPGSFFRTFSFWKVIEIPDDGKITIPVEVKRYQGELRITVNVIDKKSFAGVKYHTKAVSDLVVQPTLPRIIRKNDKVRFPLNIINTTNHELPISIEVSTGKAKKVQEKKINLTSGESKTIFFDLKSDILMGKIPVQIRASYPSGTWEDIFYVPSLPDLPYVLETYIISLTREKAVSIDNYLKTLSPESISLQIMVSYTDLFGGLRHTDRLLKYPYGCIEQTASGLFALIRLAPFLKFVSSSELDLSRLKEMIMSGIFRIEKMQTPSGGFSFWPGGTRPSPWGTIYATFVLLEAKEAGFYVPGEMLNQAIWYIKRRISPSPWREMVLARAGSFHRRNRRFIESFVASTNKTEDLLVASATFYFAGYKKKAEEIFNKAISIKSSNINPPYRYFYSPLREQAIKLYVGDLINPKNKKNGRWARAILSELNQKKGRFLTTQELAWSLVALGRHINREKYQEVKANLILGRINVSPSSQEDGLISWSIENLKEKDIKLNLLSPQNAWLSLIIRGYKQSGFHPVIDKGLLISREFVDIEGKDLISPVSGDLFLMKIMLENRTGAPCRYLAIRVPLVAGIEVENPRLFHIRIPDWTKKLPAFKPAYIDIRDDEVHIFGDLKGKKAYIFLPVRATFGYEGTIPPPRAELMYQPEIYTIGEPKYIRIE